MKISKAGAQLVARRLRYAAWIFGLMTLGLLSYVGAYTQGLIMGAVYWGAFQLGAYGLTRLAERQ
jgi:hypothetical protein